MITVKREELRVKVEMPFYGGLRRRVLKARMGGRIREVNYRGKAISVKTCITDNSLLAYLKLPNIGYYLLIY